MVLLVLIRFFEKSFFDDGLVDFFRHAYLTEDLPSLDIFHVLWVDSLRYWLNTLLSMALIYVWFRPPAVLQFLGILYLFVYLLVICWFYYEWTHYQAGDYILLFYIRRILIQPLLLLILLPALFYQKKSLST